MPVWLLQYLNHKEFLLMLEMFQLPFMLQALVACLLLAVILSYFGVHVVTRGIVFIESHRPVWLLR
jgi:hypothetical protein